MVGEVCHISTSASVYMLKLPVKVILQAGMKPLLGILLGILLGVLLVMLLVTVRIPASKNEYYIHSAPIIHPLRLTHLIVLIITFVIMWIYAEY